MHGPKPASAYPVLFAWSRRQPPGRSASGAQIDAYATVGTLWGSLDDAAASRSEYLSAEVSERRGTVRVRGRQSIAQRDTLIDLRFGEAWEVTAAAAGDLETVCDVIRRG